MPEELQRDCLIDAEARAQQCEEYRRAHAVVTPQSVLFDRSYVPSYYASIRAELPMSGAKAFRDRHVLFIFFCTQRKGCFVCFRGFGNLETSWETAWRLFADVRRLKRARLVNVDNHWCHEQPTESTSLRPSPSGACEFDEGRAATSRSRGDPGQC